MTKRKIFNDSSIDLYCYEKFAADPNTHKDNELLNSTANSDNSSTYRSGGEEKEIQIEIKKAEVDKNNTESVADVDGEKIKGILF
jgi:hypothetical protein